MGAWRKSLDKLPRAAEWLLYLPLASIIATVWFLSAFPGGDVSWGKSLSVPQVSLQEHPDEAAHAVFSPPCDTLHVTSPLLPCSNARSLCELLPKSEKGF